jgi:hypothetical protein
VTPEQTTEILKALKNHDWFLIVCGIVWLLGTILQFLIVARFKATIENRQHFSRVRYEHEIEIYREAWKVVHQFNFSESQEVLLTSRIQLFDVIEKNKPFYSDKIWSALSEFLNLATWLTMELQRPVDGQQRLEILNKVIKQREKVELAIRERLAQFDDLK